MDQRSRAREKETTGLVHARPVFTKGGSGGGGVVVGLAAAAAPSFHFLVLATSSSTTYMMRGTGVLASASRAACSVVIAILH